MPAVDAGLQTRLVGATRETEACKKDITTLYHTGFLIKLSPLQVTKLQVFLAGCHLPGQVVFNSMCRFAPFRQPVGTAILKMHCSCIHPYPFPSHLGGEGFTFRSSLLLLSRWSQ